MKMTIGRITRTAMLAVAFMLCTSSAWATAKPLAIWCGDFTDGSNRNGYVINANGNTVSADYITLDGSKGGVIVTNNTVTTENQSYPLVAVAGLEGIVYTNNRTSKEAFMTAYDSAGGAEENRALFVLWNGKTEYKTFPAYISGGAITEWTNGGHPSDTVRWPSDGGLHYFASSMVTANSNSLKTPGWRSFIDGTLSTYTDKTNSETGDKTRKLYGVTIGGTTAGFRLMNNESSNAKLRYVAIIRDGRSRGVSDSDATAKYWSLTDMTQVETATTTISGGPNVGVNLAAASTVTVSGTTKAAAVFVQADTTLKFSDGATLTIGNGSGPLYIAQGKQLTLDFSAVTAPTDEAPIIKLASCEVFGSTQVVFTGTPEGTSVSVGDRGILLVKTSYLNGKIARLNVAGQKMCAWRSDSNTRFSSANVAPVTTSTGEISDTLIGLAADDSNRVNWKNFCSGQSSPWYVAPAPALYFDNIRYIQSFPNFVPLTIGGLLVTSGDWDAAYIGRSDGYVELGDTSGTIDTYFVLLQSFTLGPFAKAGTVNKIYGKVNIELLDGAVFTLPASGITLDATTSAELKMSGSGNIKLAGTLTATGAVTLDYSNLETDASSAFIDGTVAIDGSTKFKFPSGANFPYAVANSITGTTEGTRTFEVGGVEYTRGLTFTGGAAYPSKVCATFAGGDSGTWAGLGWDLTYTNLASAPEHEVSISANGTINLGSATASKVTFNVPSDKTLTLSGTLSATEIVFAGGGKVVCSAANTLQGTIKGSATIEYPESTLPTGATLTNNEWSGTIVLAKCGASYVSGHGSVEFDTYGSVNSSIKAPLFRGYTKMDTNARCNAKLIVDSGDVFELNNGNSGSGFRFAKLAGEGKVLLDGNSATTQYLFEDVSEFSGTVEITDPGSGNKSFVFGSGSPLTWTFNYTDYQAMLVIAGDVTLASGKTWTVPAGIVVLSGNTLKVVGTTSSDTPITIKSGATLDISEAEETPAIMGSIVLEEGAKIKFANSTFPKRIAAAGTPFNGSITIITSTTSTRTMDLDSSGWLRNVTSLDIDKDTTVPSEYDSYLAGQSVTFNVTADATMTFADDLSSVGQIHFNMSEGITLKVKGDIACQFDVANGTTFAIGSGENRSFAVEDGVAVTEMHCSLGGASGTCNDAISATGTITINSDKALSAGNYTLVRWFTPQKLSSGYGKAASYSVPNGLASGCASELIYGVDRIILRVYNTSTQSGRGTIKIWPYGDSITEGYNMGGTKANYRVLLAQKLSLLGYNVKMVGCYGQINQADAIDPAGNTVKDDWKWHSAKHGATAGPTTGAPKRANLSENVDTLCAQAGNPDVVLLHIGVNDLAASDQSPASTFVSWTNVIWRLVNNLPDSKIIATTLLYGNVANSTRAGQAPNITTFNDLVRDFMASMPSEWEGHVIFLDMNTKVGTYAYRAADDGITYNASGDFLHPDWWGHDQMAEGWLSAIKAIYSANGPDTTFNSDVLPAVADGALGAANKSTLADYRAGFSRMCVLEAQKNINASSVTYSNEDPTPVSEGISKVGYFVEYVRSDNNAHNWVWVDMDAFGDCNLDAVRLPNANYQQVVTKLHVLSSHNGIDAVAANDDTATGWIEFSPFTYSAASSGVAGAPAEDNNDITGWNDTLATSGSQGTMQVFRKAPPNGRPAQTLFAFNNWNQNSTEAEFGIGNFSSHFYGGANDAQTYDYTGTKNAVKMNAAAYRVKNIEIWTKPVETWSVSNDKKGAGGGNWEFTADYLSSLHIKIPGTSGKFVRINSITLGISTRGSGAELNAKRLKIVSPSLKTETISGLANGNGNLTDATFLDSGKKAVFTFDDDCVLEEGQVYTLQLLDSSGEILTVSQDLRLESSPKEDYSPVYEDYASSGVKAWRPMQEVNVSRIHTLTLAAGANDFSVSAFAPVPVDEAAAEYLVNVPASTESTLTFGSSTTVGTIRFNIPSGSTLTIADAANLTADKVIVYGAGKLVLTGTLSANIDTYGAGIVGAVTGGVAVLEDTTTIFGSGESLSVTGSITVASGKTLNVNNTLSGASAVFLTATGGITGNVGTTSSESGYGYSVLRDVTTIKLVRTPDAVFSFDGTVGAAPTGWITSWGGEKFSDGTKLRVGPNATYPIVHEVYHVDDNSKAHPYAGLSAKTPPFSLSFYADLSKLESGNRVLAAFGNSSNGLIIYKNDDAPGTVRVGRASSGDIGSGWIGVEYPKVGYHLYTITCAADGTLSAYVDDGATYKTTNANGTKIATVAFADGFQIGSTYGGNIGWMSQGSGMALCAMRGYDAVLEQDQVAVLSKSFPATTGVITHSINLNASGKTLTVYTSAEDAVSTIFGPEAGTVTIPEGQTVSVTRFRSYQSNGSTDANTVNIVGTLNVTATDATVGSAAEDAGVIIGYYQTGGSGSRTTTVNVTGTLNAPNSYVEMPWAAKVQSALLEIAGESAVVKVKALHANSSNGKVKIHQGGTLEVSEILSSGTAIEKEFWKGTFRVKGNATETRAIKFCAGALGNATILDPYGYTLTLNDGTMTESGYVTVSDSSVGGNGIVVFGANASFGGKVLLTDENCDNMDISGYRGGIVCQGTSSAAVAKLDNFAGTVYFNSVTVDARAVNLASAKVVLSGNATVSATAGQEGTVTIDSGSTLNLYVDEDAYKYDGNVFEGTNNGTVAYYYDNGESPVSVDASYVNGNNLLPYFQIWSASSGNSGTLNTAADWSQGVPSIERPSDSGKTGNAAFKVTAGATTTINVDKDFAFGEIQIYKAGEGEGDTVVIFNQSVPGKALSANIMTIGSGIRVQVSGDEVLNITDGYISGGASLTINAGATMSLSNVDCSTMLSVAGKLSVAGTSSLTSSANTVRGTLEILDGITTFYGADRGLSGTLTIKTGATLVGLTGDFPNYDGSSTVNVYGTLTIGSEALNLRKAWTFKPNNAINLYAGATLNGYGSNSQGIMDIYALTIPVAKNPDDDTLDTVTCSGQIRLMGNVTANVAEGVTFKMPTKPWHGSQNAYANALHKNGLGTLEMCDDNVSNETMNILAGNVISTVVPGFNVSISEGATLTVKDVLTGLQGDAVKGRFSGAGTLEILNTTGSDMWINSGSYTSFTSMAGKLKFTRTGSGKFVFGSNVMGYVPFTEALAPAFELENASGHSSEVLQMNSAFVGNRMYIRNFEGSGTIAGRNNIANHAENRAISTKQSRDTTFSGIFTGTSTMATALEVLGDGSGHTHSLTLSGASTTEGALTIADNAKVVLTSTGSWENGTVCVGANGVLESKNASSVAATLTLQSGAKIAVPDTENVMLVSSLSTLSGVTYAVDLTAVPSARIDVPVLKVPTSAGIAGFDAGNVTVVPPSGSAFASGRWKAYTATEGDYTVLRVVVKPGTIFSVY